MPTSLLIRCLNVIGSFERTIILDFVAFLNNLDWFLNSFIIPMIFLTFSTEALPNKKNFVCIGKMRNFYVRSNFYWKPLLIMNIDFYDSWKPFHTQDKNVWRKWITLPYSTRRLKASVILPFQRTEILGEHMQFIIKAIIFLGKFKSSKFSL